MNAARWAEPVPRCPRHAYLHYDRRARAWLCDGWDGEGCGYTVDGDQLDYLYDETAQADTITPAGGYL